MRPVLLSLLVTCIAVVALCVPGLAAAQSAPLVTLEASPATVRIPDSFQLVARTDRDIAPTPYYIRIVDDDSGQVRAQCASGTTCTSWVQTSWGDNPDPRPRHFHAETWSPSLGVGSRADVAVQVQPAELSVSLAAAPAAVSEPDYVTVTATANRDASTMPYYIEIVDTKTGNVLRSCGSGTSCSWTAGGWGPRSYRLQARLRSTPGHVAASSAELTAVIRRLLFPVDLAFNPTGDGRYTATATTNRDVYPTPYYLRIKRSDGTQVRQCSSGTTCTSGYLEVGKTYRATVETGDGQIIVGDTGAWTLTADGPRRDVIDDVDLAHLAGMFPSAMAMCNQLAEYPGSHLMSPPATVSDQYRGCVAGANAGMTPAEILRAIATGVGGAAALGALWYLRSQAQRPLPTPGTPTTPNDATAPRPVPLPLRPQTYDLARTLVEQNPGLAQEDADDLANQCLFLVGRAALNARRKCADLPIFASGNDVPKATEHDMRAIASWPPWVALDYRHASQTPGNREWMNAEPECQGRVPGVTSCDEYPFWATMQGGPFAAKRPHLELIPFLDNRDQGLRYGNFVLNCHLDANPSFLGIPLAPELGIPTQTRICNGH